MLNAYGAARFAKFADDVLWRELCKPQKSGALWHTEMCAAEAERRGTGLNRWMHAQLEFCKNAREV